MVNGSPAGPGPHLYTAVQRRQVHGRADFPAGIVHVDFYKVFSSSGV